MPMKPASAPTTWLGVFALLLLLQLPLIFNPGYFSHDELQWWARADVAGWASLPWESWTNYRVFQYRPLTFNLWLALSHALARHPYAMHAAVVGIGSLNAVLLGVCVAAAGAPRRVAVGAALLFVLTPYVAYTHGWVATLADLLTLLMALLALRSLQSMLRESVRRDIAIAALAAALVGIALLCKESAVVLPLILLAALYRHPRPRAVLVAIGAAAAPVAIYLLVRLPTLLDTPAGSEGYAWAIGHVPPRLAEYLLFPFLPALFEVGPTLSKSPALLCVGVACLVVLLGSLAMKGWRWPTAWLVLFAGLLTPVLVLATSYGQYAYLASAAGIGVIASAWSRLRTAPRIALAIVAAVAVAHGAAIQWRMREIGVVQRNFYADLSGILPTAPAPLRITVAHESDRWMVQRFVSDVPAYRGIPMAGRVRITRSPDQDAHLTMRRDGHLAHTLP